MNHGKGKVGKIAMSIQDADPVAVRELVLFIENDSGLYRQQHLPIIKNLMLKKKKGIYDSEKAAKLFVYLAENGAKKYNKEFGDGTGYGPSFNPDTRRKVAMELRDAFEAEAKSGSYDNL